MKESNKNVNKEVFKETLEFIHVHDSCMRRISEKKDGGSGLPTPFSYALVKSYITFTKYNYQSCKPMRLKRVASKM